MAKLGQVSPAADRVNEARARLNQAMVRSLGFDLPYRDDLMTAIENYIDAKIVWASNERY